MLHSDSRARIAEPYMVAMSGAPSWFNPGLMEVISRREAMPGAVFALRMGPAAAWGLPRMGARAWWQLHPCISIIEEELRCARGWADSGKERPL